MINKGLIYAQPRKRTHDKDFIETATPIVQSWMDDEERMDLAMAAALSYSTPEQWAEVLEEQSTVALRSMTRRDGGRAVTWDDITEWKRANTQNIGSYCGIFEWPGRPLKDIVVGSGAGQRGVRQRVGVHLNDPDHRACQWKSASVDADQVIVESDGTEMDSAKTSPSPPRWMAAALSCSTPRQ